jgi:hypothetical protein
MCSSGTRWGDNTVSSAGRRVRIVWWSEPD